ncbi:uncharacterized protein [Spinacia oleracea]|uniref:Uncharacterized protein isoform X3 n=1 Tax=Spinacia oleracea TaxID=3562 RepID=A0ABM3QHA0_SPIOL|nr:uncharacterized protein LOC110797243 isoform X3 [Spinacia oleracea]
MARLVGRNCSHLILQMSPFFRFSETDKCLVRQFEQFKLIDPSKEALELVRGDSDNSQKEVTMEYTESLVSPFFTTKVKNFEVWSNYFSFCWGCNIRLLNNQSWTISFSKINEFFLCLGKRTLIMKTRMTMMMIAMMMMMMMMVMRVISRRRRRMAMLVISRRRMAMRVILRTMAKSKLIG